MTLIKRSIFFLLVLLIGFSSLPLFSQALIPKEAKNGKPHWVIGSPGRQTIISTKRNCSSVPPTRAAPMAWQPAFEHLFSRRDRKTNFLSPLENMISLLEGFHKSLYNKAIVNKCPHEEGEEKN